MPNIKSAKKRVRVTKSKTEHNKTAKSALRTQIKKANLALEENAENKEAVVRTTMKTIDQAVSKGILHKNTAARRKSSLAKQLNA